MYESSDVSTTSSSTTSAASGGRASSSGSQGLSTSASAGIGVGVGLGVIILAIAVVWFWRMRRKNAKTTAPDHHSQAESFQDSKPSGLELKTPQELQGHNAASEMDSGITPQEVPGEGLDRTRQATSPVEMA